VPLILSVLTEEMPNQSKGIFEIAKSNAAEVQMVSGLGDLAMWDNVLRVLRVVKGSHLVEVELGSDLGDLETARAIMEKMLAKLS
jgi:pantoate kinase